MKSQSLRVLLRGRVATWRRVVVAANRWSRSNLQTDPRRTVIQPVRRAGDCEREIENMPTETVQMKVSGLMCSFCTMSVEKALKPYPGVNRVFVNMVHGVVLVEAGMSKISREELAAARSIIDREVSL